MMVVRPIVSAALAIIAGVAAVYFATLFPGTEGRMFLTELGFCIAGPAFLLLLLLTTYFARLRWWDCAVPIIIPVWIGGFDISDPWTRWVWLAFVLPIAISAGFAAMLHHGKKRA